MSDRPLPGSCLVPVRLLPRPSWSMNFGDVSETNGSDQVAHTHWPRAIMRPWDQANTGQDFSIYEKCYLTYVTRNHFRR